MRLKLFSFLLIAIAALTSMSSCKKEENEKVPQPAPPVKVSVIAARGGSSAEMSRTYSGTVQSGSSASVSFAVPGTVSELYAREGDRVEKGRVLARLQNGDYINAVNIAQAQLAEALDAYERLKKLHDADALPEIKWVEIQQKVKQAENATEISRRSLGQTSVEAPMSGVITKRFVEVGQNVAPIQPLYEITSTSDLTIDISVPENEINEFKIGQTAYVSFNNEKLSPITGKVSEKAVIADPLTRTYKVKVKIPAAGENILPGMVGTVKFVDADAEIAAANSVLLPSQAVLLNHDNSTFVWVVRNNKAERRFVTVDEMVADGVLVTKGLTAADTVIVEGMQKVGSGTLVCPILK